MDTLRLEDFLRDGKFDEARSELETLLSAELSSSEKGEVLLNFAAACLKAETALDKEYIEALQAGLREIEKLDAADALLKKKQSLEDLKKDILGR